MIQRYLAILTAGSICLNVMAEEQGKPETLRPQVRFAEKSYDFGKVAAGEIVKHAFVFTNIGNATLKITAVRPGCGCTTTEDWDREVAPGKTGRIPLQLNSSSFNSHISKSATITCNDPVEPTQVLHITGTVWRPFQVTPAVVSFITSEDTETNLTKVIRITSNMEESLRITEVLNTNKAFATDLKELRPGKEYQLSVTAAAPFRGGAQGTVKLKTAAKEAPEISVPAHLIIQPAVTVAPSRLTLVKSPQGTPRRMTATVRSNSNIPLVLSDPQINLPGAEVEMREIQAGRTFSILVNVPGEVDMPQGEAVELKLNSNHPKFPQIIVPVRTVQAAATRPVPTGRAAVLRGTGSEVAPGQVAE